MIRLKKRVANRADRRQTEKEVKQVEKRVALVESLFLDELFSEDVPYSYWDSFVVFKTEYEVLYKWLMKHYNFRFIEVDPYYFRNKYWPLEKPFE